MFICGRKGFDDTLRNLYEGLFLGHRLPNNSAYFLWWKIPSSGKSDTCSLDPWQEGHRTVTSKVCQINDPTQDYGSLVSDPRKQRTVCNSSQKQQQLDLRISGCARDSPQSPGVVAPLSGCSWLRFWLPTFSWFLFPRPVNSVTV